MKIKRPCKGLLSSVHMMIPCVRQIIIFSILFLLAACDSATQAEKWDQNQSKTGEDILIGIVEDSSSSNFFLEGVNLALEEINQHGGVLGRKIQTAVYDDRKDSIRAEKIARKLAADTDVVAVIGHGASATAIPVSIIYENAGVLFISYGAKSPDLTLYSGQYTFRNIPTHKEFGAAMAEMAHDVYGDKVKKTVMFHERNPSQRSLADIFKKRAAELGIEIVATRSYFNTQKDFKEIIDQLRKEYEFDSVVICGTMPTAAKLVKQLRDMGVEGILIGGDGLDSPNLFSVAGKASEDVIVPTVFNPVYPDKMTFDFVKAFKRKYELPPDTWAAQGYDAVQLFAHAAEESGTVSPEVVSSNLRFLKKWKGVTGSYALLPTGDITDKDIYFKKMQNGDFVFLEQQQEYKSTLFTYVEDYTLRLPLRRPVTTLDPSFVNNSSSDIELCEQLFLGLTGIDPKTNEPVPELAAEWIHYEDSDNIYIFIMRQDVIWTNGEPVTAHDVVHAIQRNLKPGSQSPNAEDLYILKDAKALHQGTMTDFSKLGVYAADDFILVFQLEHPADYFPTLVSLPAYRPVPKSVVKQYGRQWTDTDKIVTNGPYQLISRDNDKGVFLKKNAQYFDADNVSVPEVRYFVITKDSVGLAMYENNELDILGGNYLRLSPSVISGIRSGPLRSEYHEKPSTCTYAYLFNTVSSPLDSLFVRKAIAAAIDRQILISAANNSLGEPAYFSTRSALLQSVDSEEEKEKTKMSFDSVQAKKWLAEAGYSAGKNFPEISILAGQSKFNNRIAISVQEFLRYYLNIKVKILSGEEQDTPHIFISMICADYPDVGSGLRFFASSDFQKKTGWDNSKVTDLLRKAESISGLKERLELYKQAEEILCGDDVVVLPLFYEIPSFLVKTRVKGWNYAAMGGQQIHTWSLEEE